MERVPDGTHFVASSGAGAVVSGFLMTLLIHVVLPISAIAIFAIDLGTKEDEEIKEIEPQITASFARLGKEIDPKDLPDRVRAGAKKIAQAQKSNAKRGAPSQKAPSKEGTKEKMPDQVVRELTAELGLDIPDEGEASTLANKDENAGETGADQQVGQEDGVEGGNSDQKTGNEYLGQLSLIFRRGWSVPSTVSSDELKTLKAVALMSVDANMKIVGCSIRTKSGNDLFDASVMERCEALKATGEPLPEPPLAVEEIFRSSAIRLRLRGTQASQ